jgi:acyl-CoA dehydrogenase
VQFELDIVEDAIRREAAAAADALIPVAAEADDSSVIHGGVLDVLRRSRLCDLVVPTEYGGRFERVNPVAVALVREQLMYQSCAADLLFVMQGIGSYALSLAGAEEVRRRWLPRVARLEAIAAFCLSEDGAGSDAKAMTTSIVEIGGQLVINGEKTFISNGGAADIYTVIGREGDGFSMALVPAATNGLVTSPTPELIAPHVLGTVRFDDVQVPVTHRIGAPGRGFDLTLSTLTCFRVSVGAAAVGLGQAALDEMVRHASTREQFGRPISRLGPVAQMIARAWAEVESARLLAYRAATIARDRPEEALPYASMAKVEGTEMASRVVDLGMQVMGRWGLIRGSRMERLYRASRPMRIYEGATEVLRMGISRALCDASTTPDRLLRS